LPAVLTAYDQSFIDKMIYASNHWRKKGQYKQVTCDYMRLIRSALTDDRKANWMKEFRDPTLFATWSVVDNVVELTAKWECLLFDKDEKIIKDFVSFFVIPPKSFYL
jgi:hypothetical protein